MRPEKLITVMGLDHLRHYVRYLDGAKWRAPCSPAPELKPRGWLKQRHLPATCLVCISGHAYFDTDDDVFLATWNEYYGSRYYSTSFANPRNNR